ncbi:MAG TPA: hypothetical protein DCL57_07120, partial [Microbacterium sp.]|nr:hypothetical protein [Microbacterium sp.]
PEQNWEVLRALPQLVAAGQRVLLGTSRKRFLAEALAEASVDAERRFTQRTGAAATRAGGEDPSGDTVGAVTEARRDGATAVTSALAARAGVWGVRVHDVAATRDALRVAELWGGSDAAAR